MVPTLVIAEKEVRDTVPLSLMLQFGASQSVTLAHMHWGTSLGSHDTLPTCLDAATFQRSETGFLTTNKEKLEARNATDTLNPSPAPVCV